MPNVVRYMCGPRFIRPLLDDVARARGMGRSALDHEMADRLNVSYATVRAWKSGASRPRQEDELKLLIAFATKFGGRDRAWVEAFLEAVDASSDLRRRLAPAEPDPAAARMQAIFTAPPLPAQDVVGRGRDLAWLETTLTGGQSAALHGMAGIGKTTLAVALAHRPAIRARFPGGVLWARLGPRGDAISELGAWARHLGLDVERLMARRGLEDWSRAIHEAIGGRAMLLIIDDAWTTEAALAFRIGGPHCARVLTTRSADIARAFAGPNTRLTPPLSAQDSNTLLALAGPRRGRQGARDAGLIAMCQGHPLSLLLLGAVAGAADDVRSRLGAARPISPMERPPALAAGTPFSLESVLTASVAQLPESQREALSAACAFAPKPGSFSREAAATVAACGPDTLEQLVRVNLLEAVEDCRLAAHQAVADYMRVHHPAPSSISDRFVAYWLRTATAIRLDLHAVDREYPNLRLAMEIARGKDTPEFTELVNRLYPYLRQAKMLPASRALFDEALAHARQAGDTYWEAFALLNTGNIAADSSPDLDAACADMWSASEAFRRIGIPYMQVDALLAIAARQAEFGDPARAEEALSVCEPLLPGLGDTASDCEAINTRGLIAWRRGEFERARERYEQGLTLAREGQLTNHIRIFLDNLGQRAFDRGAYTESDRYFREAREHALSNGNIFLAGRATWWLGRVAIARGDDGAAARHLIRARGFAQQAADTGLLANIERLLAEVRDRTILV